LLRAFAIPPPFISAKSGFAVDGIVTIYGAESMGGVGRLGMVTPMNDYVTTSAFNEEQVCSQKFLRDFTAACRKMSPLVEFTTRALGLKY
jgi:hypothetical protein